MPRENPNGDSLQNPSTRFFSWHGEEGRFRYYDKETKKNVDVEVDAKHPFIFLPLDILSTVKGYSESDKSGFVSNEVRDMTKEIMTVKVYADKKATVKASGLWSDIKDKIKAAGGKFSVSVYGAMKLDGKNLEIVNIQMYGAALTAWIEFAKNNKVFESAVAIRGAEKKNKGKIVWYVPVLEPLKVSAKSDDEAGELQKVLKEYHTAYFAKNASKGVEAEDESSASKKPAQQSKSSKKEEEVEESVDDITFDGEEEPPF